MPATPLQGAVALCPQLAAVRQHTPQIHITRRSILKSPNDAAYVNALTKFAKARVLSRVLILHGISHSRKQPADLGNGSAKVYASNFAPG
jgi:hypothetical protein